MYIFFKINSNLVVHKYYLVSFLNNFLLPYRTIFIRYNSKIQAQRMLERYKDELEVSVPTPQKMFDPNLNMDNNQPDREEYTLEQMKHDFSSDPTRKFN